MKRKEEGTGSLYDRHWGSRRKERDGSVISPGEKLRPTTLSRSAWDRGRTSESRRKIEVSTLSEGLTPGRRQDEEEEKGVRSCGEVRGRADDSDGSGEYVGV